jgi:hypothetical protein
VFDLLIAPGILQEAVMAELKTKPTDQDVEEFLASIDDAQKQADARVLTALMQEITGAPPKMWGASIVGFGDKHYTYASGREGDWFSVGFSPRKQNLTLYLTYGFEEHTDLLARLGKHSVGKACLYIKRLSGIDQAALRELIERSIVAAPDEG